jgi:hypothetical protein
MDNHFNTVLNDGWENTSTATLQLQFLDASSTLLDLSRNSDYREVDFFQMILSDEFLEKYVVDPINDRLKESMKRTSKEWARKCKPTNVNETKGFLIFYFIENFLEKVTLKTILKNGNLFVMDSYQNVAEKFFCLLSNHL